MSARVIFRLLVLLLSLGLGMLLVAAAKTYNAVDGSASDDGDACVCFSSDLPAA